VYSTFDNISGYVALHCAIGIAVPDSSINNSIPPAALPHIHGMARASARTFLMRSGLRAQLPLPQE
jgi:hypothetical protein